MPDHLVCNRTRASTALAGKRSEDMVWGVNRTLAAHGLTPTAIALGNGRLTIQTDAAG